MLKISMKSERYLHSVSSFSVLQNFYSLFKSLSLNNRVGWEKGLKQYMKCDGRKSLQKHSSKLSSTDTGHKGKEPCSYIRHHTILKVVFSGMGKIYLSTKPLAFCSYFNHVAIAEAMFHIMKGKKEYYPAFKRPFLFFSTLNKWLKYNKTRCRFICHFSFKTDNIQKPNSIFVYHEAQICRRVNMQLCHSIQPTDQV